MALRISPHPEEARSAVSKDAQPSSRLTLPPSSRGAAAVREGGLRAGDEFQQCRPAALIDPAGAQDRARDLAPLGHPLAPAAQILRQICVIAPEIAGLVLLVRQ